MNKVALVGRLTRDPEMRQTNGGTSVNRFTIAVNRRFKNSDGGYDADFISCTAFGATADFIQKYFTKGMAIGVTGRIQTGSYTNKNGDTVYTTEVVVEESEFVEGKKSSETTSAPTKQDDGFSGFDGFDGVMGGDDDDELPFN